MNQQQWSHFFAEARDCNVNEVIALIDDGIDVNIATDGRSPIDLAAEQKKWDIVKVLIDAGANVNFRNGNGWTPLFYAARDGRTDIVKAFIDAGVDVNRTIDGKSALGLAAFEEKWDTVKVLIDAGANVNFMSVDGWTPLFYAARDGLTEIVKAYIDAGVDVNRTIDRKSALDLAVRKKKWDTVKVLIDAGANVNFMNEYGWAPLVYAARDGPINLMILLIKAGANIDIFDKEPNPLFSADRPKRIILIKYATLKHGYIALNHPISIGLNEFCQKCADEVELMKRMMLNCGVSIFNYLMEANENKLALYLSEETVVRKNIFEFDIGKYLNNFCVYANDLEAHLNKGIERAYLMYEAMDCFSRKMPEDIRRNISELLTNNDLNNFLLYMKKNSETNYSNISIFLSLKVSFRNYKRKNLDLKRKYEFANI